MAHNVLYALVDKGYQFSNWYEKSMEGLTNAARKKQVPVQTLFEPEDLLREERVAPPVLVSTNATWLQSMVRLFLNRHLKPIVMGAATENLGKEVSGAMPDRKLLTAEMVNYFVSSGRTRLAFVGYEPKDINDAERAHAFLQAVSVHNLSAAQEDLFAIHEGLDRCISTFLHVYDRYTGVLCPNDFVAVKLITIAKAQGIRLPEELYLAGSGDIALCEYTSPTLTTTTLDYHAIGEQTFYLWQALKNAPDLCPVKAILPTKIICRESTEGKPVLPHATITAGPVETIDPGLQGHNDLAALYAMENCLQQCDELDRQLIRLALEELSYDAIAEQLFITQGTAQYRMKKLCMWLGVNSRKEFAKRWRKLLN